MSLRFHDLQKGFDTSTFVLGPLTGCFEPGDLISLLGQNGAGKSTFFQLITGNLDPSEGQVFLDGEAIRPESYSLKKKIGYLPQHLDLPDWVTGAEIVAYGASLFELPDAQAVIKQSMDAWDWGSYQHRPLAACSHGMRKRIGLALATIHQPYILILDEPFSGLDLFHIKALTDLLKKRCEQGKISIISTHIAPYAARLCNRSLIMDAGTLIEMPEWPSSSTDQRVSRIEAYFFKDPHADD